MVKTVSYISDRLRIVREVYEQALDDFGVAQLVEKLSTVAPTKLEIQELESLAALLIEQLTTNLNSEWLTHYINGMRQQTGEAIADLIAIELNFLSDSVTLTDDFPKDSVPCCFSVGDKVRWKPLPEPSDWGTVIGRFYAYAQHRCQWGWKYVIWLDNNSPSSAWAVADTAWEEDLDAFVGEEA